MRRRTFVAAAGATAALAGCGGGFGDGFGDRSKAQLRFVNAGTAYTSLDLTVDDTRRFQSVTYGESDDYVEVDPDQTDTTVQRPGSAVALASLTPTLAERKSYTLVAYGSEGALKTTLLDDDADAPASGRTLLRVLNAAPDAGSLDVYIVGASDSISGAVPAQSTAAYAALGSAVNVASGTWRIVVTAAGSKSDVRLDVGGLVLDDRGVATLVLTAGRGGVLVNALLLVDRGAIRRLNTTQARIRAVAAAANGGSVVAVVGTRTLLNGVRSPAVNGSYATVEAGTLVLTATVDGVAVTAPTTLTLTAGADHTLLVLGSAAQPIAALLVDDNRLPDDSARAEVRLVHAVGDLDATLALTVDFEPVADGVARAFASAPELVTASTDATLVVTASDRQDAIATLVDQTLVAGGVYSVFVTGRSGGAVAILKRDR